MEETNINEDIKLTLMELENLAEDRLNFLTTREEMNDVDLFKTVYSKELIENYIQEYDVEIKDSDFLISSYLKHIGGFDFYIQQKELEDKLPPLNRNEIKIYYSPYYSKKLLIDKLEINEQLRFDDIVKTTDWENTPLVKELHLSKEEINILKDLQNRHLISETISNDIINELKPIEDIEDEFTEENKMQEFNKIEHLFKTKFKKELQEFNDLYDTSNNSVFIGEFLKNGLKDYNIETSYCYSIDSLKEQVKNGNYHISPSQLCYCDWEKEIYISYEEQQNKWLFTDDYDVFQNYIEDKFFSKQRSLNRETASLMLEHLNTEKTLVGEWITNGKVFLATREFDENGKYLPKDKKELQEIIKYEFEKQYTYDDVCVIDLSNINVSNVNDMSLLFRECQMELTGYLGNPINKFLVEGVNSWDMSHVENANLMFKDSNIDALDVSNWDISNVESAVKMFDLQPERAHDKNEMFLIGIQTMKTPDDFDEMEMFAMGDYDTSKENRLQRQRDMVEKGYVDDITSIWFDYNQENKNEEIKPTKKMKM